MSTPSAARLAAHAIRQGFEVKRTKKGYLVLAKDGINSVLMHHTPSDYRGHKNQIARLRKIGVEIP
ncbi:MAG: hypothetical protein ACM3UO_00135 [Bacillota bacterium]